MVLPYFTRVDASAIQPLKVWAPVTYVSDEVVTCVAPPSDRYAANVLGLTLNGQNFHEDPAIRFAYFTPVTLHPAPCTLYPAPCTLYPAPCTLYPTPYTLHPAPCTLHPAPCTLHPAPCTLHPAP